MTVTNHAPTFTPPADITTPATSAAGAVVTFVASGSDLEDGSIAAVCAPASGATFAIGPTTVQCSVTDNQGASATGSFTVTVTNHAPTFTPANTAEATGPAGRIARSRRRAWTSNWPITACAVSAAPSDGRRPACTVTTSGDSASGTFTVTIVDTTPPAFTVTNIVVPSTGPGGALVPFSFTATDLVDGTVPVVCAPPGGSQFPIGTTPVSCTATDAHQNATTKNFTVTVTNGNVPPTCEAQPSVSEISWPPNHRWVPVTITGGRDADGDVVQLSIVSIFQDEPINGIADGDTEPDGDGIGTNTARVRAERAGSPKVPGNGRVYYINFTGNDGRGGQCTGTSRSACPRSIAAAPRRHRRRPAVHNSVTGARQQ